MQYNFLAVFMNTLQKVNKKDKQLKIHICPSVYRAVPCHCSTLTADQPEE